MILLSVAVIILAMTFVGLLNSLIRSGQTKELNLAAENISSMLEQGDDIQNNVEILSYYISYVVYTSEDGEVVSSNDLYIPVLPLTGEKSEHYFEKDFYLDGNLNILYVAREFRIGETDYVIQTSLNMDLDASGKMFSEMPKTIAVAIIPILIISFFVSLFITKNTIKPVVRITKSAETISSSKLDTLLPEGKHDDEISHLARTFNILFKKLKQDFDQERQFTSDVSHELKTPVAVISGQTNMLLRWGKDDPAQLEKSLTTIKNESRSMQAIIDNLLQISRIENGRITPASEPVNIKEMFNRLKDEMETYSADCTVVVNCNENIILETDVELLHQVMTVAMQNSVKYTGKGCVINLNAESVEEKIKITVDDNGPGFDQKTLPHVFERFYRGDEAHTRSAGGSGLGLSIAKTIVEALGGTIAADNCPAGGARLWMEF